MRWRGHVARMGEKRIVYRLLVGNPEGRRLLGRPRRRWIDSIKMDLINIWVGIKCWELPSGCTTCGRSSATQLHRVSYLVEWIRLAQDGYKWITIVNAVINIRIPLIA
jgi:hypothetical protein